MRPRTWGRYWGLAVCLVAAWGAGMGDARGAGDAWVVPRRAETTPEKTLDVILRFSENDNNFLEYLLKRPDYRPDPRNRYDGLVTGKLKRDLADKEAEAVKRNCGGTYKKGQVCGLDENPLTCAQDASDTPYLYLTEKEEDNTIRLSYAWTTDTPPLAVFTLVRDGQAWKLDAVTCRR